MNSKQARFLAKNPRAMIRYQSTGRLPRSYRPSSPLIDLLESLSPRERAQIHCIRLGPKLGYQCHQTFANAEMLYRFVRPRDEIFEGEAFQAEAMRLRNFAKRLTIDDLKAHQI